MKKPIESEYNSYAAYTRALEAYCDGLAQEPDELTIAYMSGLYDGKKAEREALVEFIQSYPFWIGNKAKEEIVEAIRARGNT
jgi:hypothetical protein